jgi:predicted TIM-barrel fold metal-dependent hydrolase
MDPLHGRIIDGHVHVWTPDTDRFPLAEGYAKENMDPPSFTPEELFAHCRPLGVERINLIQMSFYRGDHRYMLDAMERYPENFVGTGLLTKVNEDGSRPDELMLELSKKRVYAFRIGGGSGGDASRRWMDHPNFENIYRVGAEHNLAPSFLVNPPDLPEVDRMSERFPDTPVIIDHLARIGANHPVQEDEIDALCGLARHRKMLVKVGAFYALGEKQAPYTDLLPMIRRVVEAFGPERCMWETDCPFQVQPPHTYAASLALIREHADFLSASDKEHILVTTAERFFFKR